MKFPPHAKLLLIFGCSVVGILALYMFMASALIELITAAYNQIVTDFGNPK